MTRGSIFFAQTDHFYDEAFASGAIVQEAVWQMPSGQVGFGRDADSKRILDRLAANAFRVDLSSNQLISRFLSLPQDIGMFCRSNHRMRRSVWAPLVTDPSFVTIDRLSALITDSERRSTFWNGLESTLAGAVNTLIPLLSESAQVMIVHPGELHILHISKNSGALSRSLNSATEGLEIVVNELALNARLPKC